MNEHTSQRLTIREAAEILGISPFTVRTMIREKVLAHHKVRRRTVLDRRDVEAYFKACRVEARNKGAS